MVNRLDFSQAQEIPLEVTPCSGIDCKMEIHHSPPKRRPDEAIYCVPCAEKIFQQTPEGADYLRVRRHPAMRIAELVADRYWKRHGEKPPQRAVEEYAAFYNAWPGRIEDLDQIAQDFARLRKQHPIEWAKHYPVKPKDPLEGMKRIAAQLAHVIEKGLWVELEKQ